MMLMNQLRRPAVRGIALLGGISMLLLKADPSILSKRPTSSAEKPPQGSVVSFVLQHQPEFLKDAQSYHGILVVADPADFNCPPCFEDLESTATIARNVLETGRSHRGIYLIRQAEAGPWRDSATVERWARMQGFPFPALMVPESTYASFALSKTSVFIVDGRFHEIFRASVPFTRTQREQMRALMEE